MLPFGRRRAWYDRRFAPFGACHSQTIFPAVSTSRIRLSASTAIKVVPASVRWLLRMRMFAMFGRSYFHTTFLSGVTSITRPSFASPISVFPFGRRCAASGCSSPSL